jgi:hypothetical protein
MIYPDGTANLFSPATMQNARMSSLGLDSSEVERLDASTFNVGIYFSLSSFQMEHLVDMCCDDLNLVVDVLNTFCNQGRLRLDSLENAVEQGDLSTTVFDSMFILGASKNIGARPLADAVETVLDVIRTIVNCECLSDEPNTLCFPPCTDAAERANWQCALVTAGRAVRGCFDQLDIDARQTTASISRHLTMATPVHTRKTPPTKIHPAHRRPSEPALTMTSPPTALRRLSLPAVQINFK